MDKRGGTGRINSLDGLRGLMTVIIVWFYHYYWLAGNAEPIPGRIAHTLYTKGYFVVETFFVLSGFGMACGYKDRIKGMEGTIYSYLWKRMRKLWPVSIVALIVSVLLQLLYRSVIGSWFQVAEVSLYTIILSALNISSGWFVLDVNLNMPLWYLSALMFDYVLFYWVCKLSKNRGMYVSFISIVAFIGISIVITGWKSDLPFTYYNIARGHECFFIGALLWELYCWINTDRARELVSRICLLALVIVGVVVYFYGGDTAIGICDKPSPIITQVVWGTVLSPMLLLVCAWNPLFKRAMSVRPLKKLGGMSLSLYIWHFPCYQLLRIVDIFIPLKQYYNTLWFYGITIVYISVVAIASHIYLEPWLDKASKCIINFLHVDGD